MHRLDFEAIEGKISLLNKALEKPIVTRLRPFVFSRYVAIIHQENGRIDVAVVQISAM